MDTKRGETELKVLKPANWSFIRKRGRKWRKNRAVEMFEEKRGRGAPVHRMHLSSCDMCKSYVLCYQEGKNPHKGGRTQRHYGKTEETIEDMGNSMNLNPMLQKTVETNGDSMNKHAKLMHVIPHEIVVQILSMVTVKTILRCNPICKLWKSMTPKIQALHNRKEGTKLSCHYLHFGYSGETWENISFHWIINSP